MDFVTQLRNLRSQPIDKSRVDELLKSVKQLDEAVRTSVDVLDFKKGNDGGLAECEQLVQTREVCHGKQINLKFEKN